MNWICVDVAVNRDPDPDPCICPDWALDILIDPVLPVDLRTRFVDRLGGGLSLLSQASVVDNPRQAAYLRGQAQAAFVEAARLGGERAGYRLGGAGTRERDGSFAPHPWPWLEAAGEHLARGLGLMSAALDEPRPDPWFEHAMDEFQQSVELLQAGVTV